MFGKKKPDEKSSSLLSPPPPPPETFAPPSKWPREHSGVATVTRSSVITPGNGSAYLYFVVIIANPDKEGEEMALALSIYVESNRHIVLAEPGDKIDLKIGQHAETSDWAYKEAKLRLRVPTERARLKTGNSTSNLDER